MTGSVGAPTMASRTLWSGTGGGVAPAREARIANASSIEPSVISGLCAVAIVAHPERTHRVTQRPVAPLVDQAEPRRQRVVHEHRHALPPELRVQLGDGADRTAGHRRRERVDPPVHAGPFVEEATRGRRVPHRRTHRASVRSPTSKLSPSLTHRIRASGNSNALVCRSLIAQVATSVAFVHARHHLFEVAGVVDVVVRQVHPAHVRRVDQAEHVVEPLPPVGDRAGVDDHWLLTHDHHRVQVHGEWLRRVRPAPGGSPRCRGRSARAPRGSSAVRV